MVFQKPLTFLNVTPINPNGMTVVDLGEMDEGLGSARHVSSPPITETRTPPHPHSSLKGGRHRSLPPKTMKTVKIKSASSISTGSAISSSEEPDSEIDDESALGKETGPSEGPSEAGPSETGPSETGPSSTTGDNQEKNSAETSTSTSRGEGDDEAIASLRTSNGAKIPRSSAVIRKENIKTYWFAVWNNAAINKPFSLHTSVDLELGDLFINQFYSEKHKTHVLQVWVLVTESGSKNYMWRQVSPNEKVHHPKLKKRILAFQPSDARTSPTWILPNTDRRPRAMPTIVQGLDE